MLIPIISKEEYDKLKNREVLIVSSVEELPEDVSNGQTALLIEGKKVKELIYHDGWMYKIK